MLSVVCKTLWPPLPCSLLCCNVPSAPLPVPLSATKYYHTCLGLAKPYIRAIYDRIFGDFPAKNTVHTPYIIYIYIYNMVLANPYASIHSFPFFNFPSQHELPSILDRYREYKSNIPVYGAILLDTELERVLLVGSRVHACNFVCLCLSVRARACVRMITCLVFMVHFKFWAC